MQFAFHHGTPNKDAANAINTMVAAANGTPLPGRWGLIQTLCNVWTANTPVPHAGQAHKALWVAKSALASVGVYQAYRENAGTVTRAKPDPFREFCKENNLDTPSPYLAMSQLILEASSGVPYVDANLRDDKDTVVRRYTPPGGTPFYFKLFIAAEGQRAVPLDGPLFVKGAEADGLRTIRDILWTQYRSRTLRLTVAAMPTYMGGYSDDLDLSDAGAPDPYISDAASADWTSAHNYATRCRTFMARGFVRGVLFHGPPGTGKTSLAMSVLGDAGRILKITDSAISRSDFSHIAGLIHILDPRVILFDDIDRFSSHDLARMLEYMEDLKKNPPPEGRIIIGTVNAIDTIDPALLRAGRFDEVIHVSEPGQAKRLAIISHYITFYGEHAEGLDPTTLTAMMDGFSPADIRSVIESVSCVGAEHLEAEVDRARLQRALFAGDKVLDYLKDKNQKMMVTG